LNLFSKLKLSSYYKTRNPNSESDYNIGDEIGIKDRKSTYPTEDVSSSFFERVIVIIDTCLVVSKLQDGQC